MQSPPTRAEPQRAIPPQATAGDPADLPGVSTTQTPLGHDPAHRVQRHDVAEHELTIGPRSTIVAGPSILLARVGKSVGANVRSMEGEAVLAEAVAAYQAVLGERLLAAYALGSLAHGGFSRLVSDIDLGLIVSDPLRSDDAEAIQAVAETEKAKGLGAPRAALGLLGNAVHAARRTIRRTLSCAGSPRPA